jgi:hypothetical protein
MQIGIVGLNQSGKTALFNALTGGAIQTGIAGAGKREAHVGIVKIPDTRLDALHELEPKARKVQTTLECVDVAGVTKGSGAKGFDDQFLGALRTVDAIVLVARGFDNPAVPHDEGSVDASRDIRAVLDEFLFSDLAIVDNRIPRLEAQLRKSKNEKQERELALIKGCHARLENNQPLREMELSIDDEKLLRGYQFLTSKPLLIVVNMNESDIPRTTAIEEDYRQQFSGNKVDCVALSAAIEMEISQLGVEDAENFRKDLQIVEPALNKMIRTAYNLLGLISFFTFGDKEVRAWTCRRGATASQAAGVIHSDFERGFIRAEVTFYEDLLRLKSWARCREQALLRLEGRDYLVKDGDVIEFRFNV